MSNVLSNILTEAGTNELEVLIFSLNGANYGTNVAKVREIIPLVPLTRVPEMHPAVKGTFQLRNRVLPLIDLRSYFKMPPLPTNDEGRVLILEFNNVVTSFLVDRVDRIFRMGWDQIMPSPIQDAKGDSSITGIIKLDKRLILLVDFERIVFKVAGISSLQKPKPQQIGQDRSTIKMILAEDSGHIRMMLKDALSDAGFSQLTIASDGEEAWNIICKRKQEGCLPDIVVTDIEMPKMDGLHLTKRIKEDPVLKKIPVIVFSSLISNSNLKKCQAVGVDRQVTKPELPKLVDIVDEVLASANKAA